MDYKKLGLKVGLEIHQQLDAKHKLFCNCPIKKSEEFPIKVRRRLRAVAGELGEVDPAALYEFLRGREFAYKINPESSCLIEIDEEPPKPLNKNALKIGIQICKILNCNIVNEVNVMRKTVIDGSSVSGFQRTALIGYDGFLKTSFGRLGVQTICLEEDAATTLKQEKGIVEYRLDRLGIPLIEIATSADISTPEQARETAEKLGLLLRSVAVIRGIGSIRQDVNISIKDGARIEIKGFQELEKIPELIKNEVARQLSLIELRDELKKRGLKAIDTKPVNVTKLFENTKCNFIRKAISNGDVFALSLPKFSGLFEKQCGDHTIGKEFSYYAEAYGFGIIHSDEDIAKYGLTEEFAKLRKGDELVLIVAGKRPEKAINAVLERAKQALKGVPEETRASHDIGSRYTRPLPGSERMYPETDIPSVRIDKKMLSIKRPETLVEIEKKLNKKMPKEMVSQIIRSKRYPLFEELNNKFNMPVIIANTLLSTMKDLKRKGFDVDKITKKDLERIFGLVKKKKIADSSLPEALELITKGITDIEKRFSLLSEKELGNIISSVVKANPGKEQGTLMGIVMSKVRGRASGKDVMKMLKLMKKK